VNGGGGSRNTRRFSKVDYLVGLLEDVKWVHTFKLGKSVRRLILAWLKAMFTGLVICLPIAIALGQANCKNELNLHRASLLPWNISMTEAGIWTPEQTQWCEEFNQDPKVKPGRPCACPLRSHGPRICNALLDPSFALIDGDGWCEEFKQAANNELQVSSQVPCECLSLVEQHLPDFTKPLFHGMWLVSTPYSTNLTCHKCIVMHFDEPNSRQAGAM
jgi:hypothetical protein